jgi:hypothetical protein
MLMVPEWQRQLLNCSLSDSDELPYLGIKKLNSFITVYIINVSFICLDLIIKNREISIRRYFKWWISTN